MLLTHLARLSTDDIGIMRMDKDLESSAWIKEGWKDCKTDAKQQERNCPSFCQRGFPKRLLPHQDLAETQEKTRNGDDVQQEVAKATRDDET